MLKLDVPNRLESPMFKLELLTRYRHIPDGSIIFRASFIEVLSISFGKNSIMPAILEMGDSSFVVVIVAAIIIPAANIILYFIFNDIIRSPKTNARPVIDFVKIRQVMVINILIIYFRCFSLLVNDKIYTPIKFMAA